MYPPAAPAHFRTNWDDVRAHGRVVHLLACGGTGYSDLAQVAQGDVAVIVGAVAFESDDRTD